MPESVFLPAWGRVNGPPKAPTNLDGSSHHERREREREAEAATRDKRG
jgi:hypothetical protein